MHVKIGWVQHEVLDIDGAEGGAVAGVVRRVEGKGKGRPVQDGSDKVA